MTDKDDEARLGAYAPPADDYHMFDAREEEARRGPLLLTAAVTVAVLFGAVVWKAYEQGLRENGRDGVPRIVAEEEPYRERPADPGGVETPDTNLDVYNRLTGDSDSAEDVTLTPAPEEPIDTGRPALRVETVDDTTPASTPEPEASAPEVTPRPAPERPQPEPAAPARTEPAPADPAPAAVETSPPPAAQLDAVPTADVSGAFVVQIASFRSQADAEAAWLAFRTRYSDISSGLAPDIAQVEIANRGTYHRLRIAAFSTRDDAVQFCSTLQSRGQDCLVARR